MKPRRGGASLYSGPPVVYTYGMKHLLPAYLFTTLTAGVVSLFVLYLVNRRLKNRSLTFYTIICACLSAAVLCNLLLFYLGINISGTLSPGSIILVYSGMPVSALMQVLIPILVHRLYAVSWQKIGNRIAIALVAAQTVLVFTPWFLRYDSATQRLELGWAFMVPSILLIAFIVYALVIGFAFRSRLDKSLRKLIRNFLLLLLVALPGLIHDETYFATNSSIETIPVTLIFFPLYFLALSIGNIAYGLRFLTGAPGADVGHGPYAAGLVSTEIADAEGRLEELCVSYALSERERAVARLVVQGLGNKQIAAELDISVKTVNNHVYNLFQKLGINSRFELMARLSSQ